MNTEDLMVSPLSGCGVVCVLIGGSTVMMGSTFRTEREKRGLTIKDAERETSIRAKYLEALEQGAYDVLPSEVYVKGFIRNYAKFLHLNGEALVQEYREEIHGTDVAPIAPTAPETTSMVNEHAPFSSGSDFHERVEKSHKKQIFAVMAAAVVLLFVGSVYYFFGDDPSAQKPQQAAQQSSAQKPQQASQTQPTTPAQPSRTVAQSQPQQATQQTVTGSAIGNTANASAGQADVTAKFTGRCWVQAIADGKVVYEGMAEANQTMRWTGKKELIVTAGNAGAVDVTYNGQRVGKLGKEGAVVEKIFSNGKVEDVK